VLLLNNEDDTDAKLLRVPKGSIEKPKYVDKYFKLNDESGVAEWLIEQEESDRVLHGELTLCAPTLRAAAAPGSPATISHTPTP